MAAAVAAPPTDDAGEPLLLLVMLVHMLRGSVRMRNVRGLRGELHVVVVRRVRAVDDAVDVTANSATTHQLRRRRRQHQAVAIYLTVAHAPALDRHPLVACTPVTATAPVARAEEVPEAAAIPSAPVPVGRGRAARAHAFAEAMGAQAAAPEGATAAAARFGGSLLRQQPGVPRVKPLDPAQLQ